MALFIGGGPHLRICGLHNGKLVAISSNCCNFLSSIFYLSLMSHDECKKIRNLP
jgi:hypothetical protein